VQPVEGRRRVSVHARSATAKDRRPTRRPRQISSLSSLLAAFLRSLPSCRGTILLTISNASARICEGDRSGRQRSISQTKNARRLTVSDPWNLKKMVSRLGKVMPVKPAWLMAFIMVAGERWRGDREFRKILKENLAEGVRTDCRKARHIGWVLRRSTPVALRRGRGGSGLFSDDGTRKF
jgi:hypothetical protein